MPLHYLAWREALETYRLQFDEDRFYAMAGQPTVSIARQLLAEQQVVGDATEIAQFKENAFLALLPRVTPIEPVVEIARAFRPHKPMGVGSGSNRDVVQQVLKTIGLADFFDAIVGAEDTDRHKPEPDVFLEVARRIEVEPNQCLVFEDADLGVEAAKRAGMGCFDIRSIFRPERITTP